MSSSSTNASPRRPRGLLDFVRHLHPVNVFETSLSPTATLGLGLIALILFVLLLLTGLLLMIYYVPHPDAAYGSIQDLHAVVPFGGVARNLHRWAGHALVAVVGLHLLRAFLTGAYKGRRRTGIWTSGVWLLIVTLAFAFTGYLLPWDQLSYWAVSIGGHLALNIPLIGEFAQRSLLGGESVSGTTLVRFYALHVGILPMISVVMIIVHVYRLRRAGGLARSEAHENAPRLPAWPRLYERELILLFVVFAALLAVSLFLDAPLGTEPDPAHPEDPSKAPWYFLFLQELVSYSALLGGVLVPALAVVGLYLVPHLDKDITARGRWLPSRPAKTAFAGGLVIGVAANVAMLAVLAPTETGGSVIVDPALILIIAAGLTTAVTWLWSRRGLPKQAAQLALLALGGFAVSALVILTVIAWYRGPSWSLVLPWGLG